jgi:hypothetical protein
MRKEIVLLIVLVAVLAGLLYFSKSFHTVSEPDARKFFLENLAQNYPNAEVREIVDVISLEGGKTLRLKARVSSGLSTPCPERLHVYYNYPSKNFIFEVENVTYGCVVCPNTPTCVILFPEEAIIVSHKYQGGENASNYISQYPDAIPKAELLPEYGGMQNVWNVTWDSKSAPDMVEVYISQPQDKIIESKTTPK